MSPSTRKRSSAVQYASRRRWRRAFTLIDFTVAIGILGVLATAGLVSIGPSMALLRTTDASRDYYVGQLNSALTQLQSQRFLLKKISNFPTKEGESGAIPICKEGIKHDYGCVNLDILVGSGFLAKLPVDTIEPCENYTGYEVYKVKNQPFTIALHKGKKGSDELTKLCYLDTVGPNISDIAATFWADTASVTWVTDERATSQIRYWIDASEVFTTSLNTTLQTNQNDMISGLLSYSTYSYQVLSRDAAGNLSASDVQTFTTGDTQKPVFLGTPLVQLTETSALITWTTDEVSDSQINYGLDASYGQSTVLNTNDVITHVQKITGLTPLTTYHFQLLSRDAANNLAKSVDYTFRTLADINPPVADNIVVTTLGSNVTISWTTNELSDTQVEYGTTTAYGTFEPIIADPILRIMHSVTLTGVPSGITYHFRVRSKDVYNNQGVSNDKTFLLVDTTPPFLASVPTVTNITGTAATISWTTTEASFRQVEYGPTVTYASGPTGLVTTPATTHTQVIQGLAYNTTYHFKVLLRDIYGNQTYSPDYTFVTANGVYSPVVATTHSSATLTWNTYEPATSRLQISSSPQFTTLVASSATGSVLLTHRRTVQGLTPSTNYYWKIISKDTAAVVATQTGSLSTTPDLSPPKITGVSPSDGGWMNSGSSITWTTDEISDTRVYVSQSNAVDGTGLLSSSVLTSYNSSDVTSHTRPQPGGMTDGLWYFQVRSIDASPANNTATWRLSTPTSFNRDTVAPGLTNVNVPAATNLGSQVTLQATGTEPVRFRVRYGTSSSCKVTSAGTSVTPGCSINTGYVPTGHASGVQSIVLTGLAPNTTYYYAIQVLDRASNTFYFPGANSGSQFTTLTDVAPPIMTLQNITNLNTATATVTWTTDENAHPRISYGLTTALGTTNNQTTMSTSHSRNMTSLVMNQTYYFRLESKDAAGNIGYHPSASTTCAVRTDNIPPTTHSFTQTMTDAGATGTATFRWRATEGGKPDGRYKVFGGLSWTDLAAGSFVSSGALSTMTVNGLTKNTRYEYEMWTLDGQGTVCGSRNEIMTNNSSPKITGNFWVDFDPPALTNISTSNITETGAFISWNSSELGNSTVEYGVTTAYGSSSGETVLVTSHGIQLKGLQPNTQYHYRVKTTDGSGNEGASANFTFTTIDITPPVISSIAITPADTTATITWLTNENSNSQVEYGTTTAYGNFTTLDAAHVMNHSVVVSGLTPNVQYQFRVISKDPANNGTTSGNQTFITSDTTPPVISSMQSTGINDDGATVTWLTNELATSQVEYSRFSNFSTSSTTTIDPTLLANHSVTLTGLDAGTTYYYRAISKDANNNSSTATPALTFTTAIDTTPPVISAIAYSIDAAALTTTITWTTDEPSTSSLEYGRSSGYGTTITDAAYVTSHSLTITSISPNVQYHFRVGSTDVHSNTRLSGNNTFIDVDTSPPVNVSGPTVSAVTATTATIEWTTDELATTQVDYGLTPTYTNQYIDGDLKFTHSAVITGIGAVGSDITYNYRVKTIDAAGNPLTADNATFITDGTAPIVTGWSVTDVSQNGFTVNWTTNEPSTSKVDYGTTVSYGSSTDNDLTLKTNHSRVITGLSANTNYHFNIVSLDKGQNQNVVTDLNRTTLP